MKHYISSYSELIKKAGLSHNGPLPSMEHLIKWHSLTTDLNLLHSSVIYVIDYTQLKYTLMLGHENEILGYPLQYLIDAGPEILFDICHPDDLVNVNQKIYPANILYMNKNSLASHQFSFSMTFRLKSKNGNFHQLNQRSSFVNINENGIPLAAVGIMSDISVFKNDDRMIHTIEDHSIQGKTKNIVTYLYPGDSLQILSGREWEVLKWICDGFSSKQIADKMHVSIHTINNHRKNMIAKTNCKNIAELLNHAIKVRML